MNVDKKKTYFELGLGFIISDVFYLENNYLLFQFIKFPVKSSFYKTLITVCNVFQE